MNNNNALDILSKEIPHSIAIEQALLASLMNIPGSFDSVSALVMSDDFYSERHRYIYDCIGHLSLIGQPYDVLAVYDSLARQDLLRKVGNEEYLSEIEKSAATMFNLMFYAEKVRELSVYRNLIKVANNMLSMAYHPKKQSIAEILDKAEADIFAINESQKRNQGTQGLKSGVEVLSETLDTIEELSNRDSGSLLGMDTSFTELNNKTQGLQKGDLVVLAARPSMGKTSFALNIIQAALLSNLPVVMFSMEMNAQSIMIRLLSAWGKINQSKVRSGMLTQDEWANINSAVTMLSDKAFYIDDRNNLPPSELRSVCRKIAKKYNNSLGLVVVDYLQLMKVPNLSGNRVAEISEISRSLKALAREMNCPVIALSQLSRATENRPDKRPVMSDLRESGAIEQDADVVMFIYRDEVYNKDRADNKGIAEIIIGKNRNGPIGSIKLAFYGEYTLFNDLTHENIGYSDSDEVF